MAWCCVYTWCRCKQASGIRFLYFWSHRPSGPSVDSTHHPPFRPRSVHVRSRGDGQADETSAAPRPKGMAPFRQDLRRAWVRLVRRTSPAHRRFVWLLVLVGAALRVARVNEAVSYDEALTWTHYASQRLWFVLSNYTFTSNHVLHSVLVKVSTGIFGVHLWSLRLPALLAGIAVMPLYYAFVRAMFNRYIAVLALALVAASGPLVEYSALARGYSLTWLFLVCALLAGRHFVKRENTVSGALMAVFCALGLWAVPTMAYAAVLVYLWAFLYLATTYRSTLQRRALKLLGSLVLCVAVSLLFYAPLIGAHGLDHLLQHPSLGEPSWKRFLQSEQDEAFALWVYFTDTGATWISLLGIIGVVYAAYTSRKYRLLLVALLLSTVPLVLVQRLVAPPRVWTYTLFFLHLSSAIAVFYFLKFLQERVHAGIAKRRRTAVAALVIAAGMGWLGMTAPREVPERFPDAVRAAGWAREHLRPGDRVWARPPWDAPMGFHLACMRLDPTIGGRPAPGAALYVLVGPGDGQTLSGVLRGNGLPDTAAVRFRKVEDWHRLEIFAAR